jgi:cell division septation protein DedD
VTHGPAPEVLKAEELGYSEQLGKKHDGPTPSRGIDSHEPKAQDKKPEPKTEPKPEQKTADKTAKPAASASDKAAAKLADQKADQKPGQKPGQKAEQKPGQKPTDPKAQDKKAGEKPDPDTQRYDYAYQAATFPNAESAASYLKRVKSLGLKGDIESGNTDGKAWHRVVVFFQGTPTDTRSLKEKLAGIGAQKLVMRSKTPAN